MSKLKIFLFFALFCVPCAYIANFIYAVQSNATGGTFGDTFGAANAIFSGSALMALIYAIILQREELGVVKDERKDTQKILERQTELNDLQKSVLAQQLLEQSFYSLLSIAQEERTRLLSTAEGSKISTLNRASNCSRSLLTVKVNETPLHPDKKLEIDLIADQAYNYCVLLANLNRIRKHHKEFTENNELLKSSIAGLIDLQFSYCLTWYVVSADFKNQAINSLFLDFKAVETIDEETSKLVRKAAPDPGWA